jgi:NAD(P)-dependent dehydrogenase (short-subunit alcohol dehydrogenase family)
MSDFSDRAGLVTGAGTGIGRAAAVAFGRGGAAVAVLDLREQEANKTARLVEQAGGRALPIVVDIADETAVKDAVDHAAATFGQLDFAHNNAGIQGTANLLTELPLDEWNRVLRVNLTGVFFCMKYELPHMVRAGGGAIVNTSSAAGIHAIPGSPAYVASKHGVVGLSKAAAIDYAKDGVRVNCVCPSLTLTPMYDSVVASGIDLTAGISAIPLGRPAEADEIAEAVVWLCSPAASYVTALTMSLDGGRRA